MEKVSVKWRGRFLEKEVDDEAEDEEDEDEDEDIFFS